MKSNVLTIINLLGALTMSALGSVECNSIGKEMKREITRDTRRILVVVDAVLSRHPGCACEIVSAAISLFPDDNEMIRQIVVTAVAAAPAEAPKIAECAIASAPEAAPEIAAGWDEVFEREKAGASTRASILAKAEKDVVVEEGESPRNRTITVFGFSMIARKGFSTVVADEEQPDAGIVREMEKRPKSKAGAVPPCQKARDAN